MRYLVLAGSFFLSLGLLAQSRSTDSLELQKTVKWLEEKLSITYFNTTDREWWINDFNFNPKNHHILIKNTATDRLGKPGGKTYLQRSFRLSDMNPYTISVEPVGENSGRMVVGNSIRIGVYKHERKVEQTKNGMGATAQTSVYFAVPKYVEDSVKALSENLAEEFKKAILLATKVYTTSDRLSQLRALMSDRFQGDLNWETQPVFENTLMVEEYVGEDLTRVLFFRFAESQVYLTQVNKDGTNTVLPLTPDSPIPGLSGPAFKLSFENKNEIHLTEGGSTKVLYRDWGFSSEAQYR